MTHTNETRRARTLAFVFGGGSVLIELILLIAISHAQAPEGRFLAGERCASVTTIEASPVILLRKFEVSL